MLSKRASEVKPSATLAISARAKELGAEHDITSFGAGEPDFDTPEHIKQAAVEALERGETKYTPASGTLELKEAIVASLKRDVGLDYAPDQVVVSCGAKHSLYNIFVAICEEGHEVLIPSPYWLSYPEMVALAGAKPIYLRLREEDGFQLDPEQLAASITPHTKVVIINSPSNPTGVIFQEEVLRRVAELAEEKDFYIVSDEIYDKMVYDGDSYLSIATLGEEFKERTIIVNGVSKTYAMTGWRIGWAVGPREIIKAMGSIQSHSTSNPTSFAQAGALAALKGPQDCVEVMVGEFKKRRELMMDLLSQVPLVSTVKPAGAFYVFPNVSTYYGKSCDGFEVNSSVEMAQFLLEKVFLALVPGTPFGSDAHIRLSYATGTEQIKKGVERLSEGLAALK